MLLVEGYCETALLDTYITSSLPDVISEIHEILICKMLRLFVNTFTVDDKYCLLKRDNLTQPIQMQLSQKQKNLDHFVSAVLKFTLNYGHFQKRMTLIANVYPKLRTPKGVVR